MNERVSETTFTSSHCTFAIACPCSPSLLVVGRVHFCIASLYGCQWAFEWSAHPPPPHRPAYVRIGHVCFESLICAIELAPSTPNKASHSRKFLSLWRGDASFRFVKVFPSFGQ